jgi:Asp-tRNA(Asn)/Glu-tRNA(Gln) amidotransferase A subunit family amidase
LKGRPQPGIHGGGEYLVAVLSKEPAPDLESTVLLDRSRKLIGEEVAEGRRDAQRVRHLEAVVKDLEQQNAQLRAVWLPPEEAKRRYDLQQVIIDRLLGVIQANARDAQGADEGTRTELQERRRREELENMVSVRLVLRAKSMLDRAPALKSLVKGIVKPFV